MSDSPAGRDVRRQLRKELKQAHVQAEAAANVSPAKRVPASSGSYPGSSREPDIRRSSRQQRDLMLWVSGLVLSAASLFGLTCVVFGAANAVGDIVSDQLPVCDGGATHQGKACETQHRKNAAAQLDRLAMDAVLSFLLVGGVAGGGSVRRRATRAKTAEQAVHQQRIAPPTASPPESAVVPALKAAPARLSQDALDARGRCAQLRKTLLSLAPDNIEASRAVQALLESEAAFRRLPDPGQRLAGGMPAEKQLREQYVALEAILRREIDAATTADSTVIAAKSAYLRDAAPLPNDLDLDDEV